VSDEMLGSMGLDPAARAFLPVATRCVKAYLEGFTGNGCASMVEHVFGEQMYADIYGLGRDEVLRYLKLAKPLFPPGYAAAIETPLFVAWLDDFFAYGGEPAPDGGAVQ